MATQEFPIYYINLDSNTGRLASIAAHLAAAGVTDAIRVPAFDGRNVDLTTAKDCDLSAALRFMGRPLRGGEYGCYRSHLDCLERFCASGSRYAVVLEDDALPPPGLVESVRQTIRHLEERDLRWDVVHLGPDRLKTFSPVATLETGEALVRAYYFPMGTSALLWSLEGACRILKQHSVVTMPIDNLLREIMTQAGFGYALWPPLIRTADAVSDIDGTGAKRKQMDRTLAYGWLKQRRLLKNKLAARHRKIEDRP
ncbi:MAG: glycosyltransferase family 25 protein [Pararhodobacter sp.]